MCIMISYIICINDSDITYTHINMILVIIMIQHILVDAIACGQSQDILLLIIIIVIIILTMIIILLILIIQQYTMTWQ